uniref:Uncharacterized protein n=1 Tax=Arundo donax TaxID=35708 RepID=A0A0A9FVH4_ARUDO
MFQMLRLKKLSRVLCIISKIDHILGNFNQIVYVARLQCLLLHDIFVTQ